MKVAGQHYRTIWLKPDEPSVVQIIDQTALPHRFVVEDVTTVEKMATAIRDMHVRGAGLIGAAAGYGMYLGALGAVNSEDFDRRISGAATQLKATRPTAVNLAWAIERQLARIATGRNIEKKIAIALETAEQIATEDAEHCRQIGLHGLELIQQVANRKGNQPDQHLDSLQRRLAGVCGPRIRHGANLRRSRPRDASARLGR